MTWMKFNCPQWDEDDLALILACALIGADITIMIEIIRILIHLKG